MFFKLQSEKTEWRRGGAVSDGLCPAAAILPSRPTDKAGKRGLPDIPLYNQFYIFRRPLPQVEAGRSNQKEFRMTLIFNSDGFPVYFEQAPTIIVRDPLAEFLGAAEHGLMTYRYVDAVRLAGHSCPTVAGAYLMVCRGLKALYGDDVPERGGIEVRMRDGRDEGTTGVVASVATLLTGAATEQGFGGIGMNRRFARRDLLAFNGNIDGTLSLRRRDTGATAEIDYHAQRVPFAPQMAEVMPKAVSGTASDEELRLFKELWQERTRTILVDHADDDGLIEIRLK